MSPIVQLIKNKNLPEYESRCISLFVYYVLLVQLSGFSEIYGRSRFD